VMRGDRERSLRAGCDGYIQKPIDIDILSEQLERYLGQNGHGR
jgi:two-component system cell cycle response regulator DivK